MSDQGMLAAIRKALARRLASWAVSLADVAEAAEQDEAVEQQIEPVLPVADKDGRPASGEAASSTALSLAEPGMRAESGEPPAHWLAYVRQRAPQLNWGGGKAPQEPLSTTPPAASQHRATGEQVPSVVKDRGPASPQSAEEEALTPDLEHPSDSAEPAPPAEPTRPASVNPDQDKERDNPVIVAQADTPAESEASSEREPTPIATEPVARGISKTPPGDQGSRDDAYADAWQQKPAITLRPGAGRSSSRTEPEDISLAQRLPPDRQVQSELDIAPRAETEHAQQSALTPAGHQTSRALTRAVDAQEGEGPPSDEMPAKNAAPDLVTTTDRPAAPMMTNRETGPALVPSTSTAVASRHAGSARMTAEPEPSADAMQGVTSHLHGQINPKETGDITTRLDQSWPRGSWPTLSEARPDQEVSDPASAAEFSLPPDPWPKLPDHPLLSIDHLQAEESLEQRELQQRLWRRRQRLESEQRGKLWNGSLF